MAQRTLIVLEDDLTGGDLGDDGQTFEFTWMGVDYTIDLNAKNAAAFEKAMQKYLEAATRIGGRKKRSSGGGGSISHNRTEDLAAIREWAAENNYEVSSRGRIPQHVMDAFAQARAS